MLVVRRIEIGEVELTDGCRNLERVAPHRATIADEELAEPRSSSGRNERAAHCFTYAIWTPVVESTRSAASIRLVSRIGKSGEVE